MNSEEIAILGTVVAVIGAIIAIVTSAGARRHRERTMRLSLFETELQRPDLDPETRRELLKKLMRDEEHPLKWLFSTSLWATLWFGVGWMIFVIAGGALALDVIGVTRFGDVRSLVAATVCGLAMLSLPFGLRELRRRDLAQER